MTDLDELVTEARTAMAAPVHERVSRCFDVLPRMLAALDHVALYRIEVVDTRDLLTTHVRKLREAIWEAQRKHPEVTYNSGPIQREMVAIRELLDRLERLLSAGGVA